MRVSDEDLRVAFRELGHHPIWDNEFVEHILLDLRDLREKARALDFIDIGQLGRIMDCEPYYPWPRMVSVLFLTSLSEAITSLRAELEQTTMKR